MEKFTAVSPVTGETIASYPMATPGEIADAMQRARRAFAAWHKTTVAQRLSYVSAMKKILVDELDETVAMITLATGKVDVDALTGDIFTCVDMIRYYEKHAAKILHAQKRRRHLLFPGSKFHVEYSPIGVVAIFSPWNYPLQLALVPAISALIAGNTVLVKPSEITPTVGDWLAQVCRRVAMPVDVLQVVQGDGRVGEEIIRARPDKIFFTGSVATGKKIMRAAAEHLIPVELELGGKDAMIVFEDANFDRAVNGAVYGAFSNAGQVCVSVERLYVQETIYPKFMEALVAATGKVKVGKGAEADVGAITNPLQKQIVDRHIDDALAKGAQLATPRKCQGNYHYPVILKDVNHDMQAMRQETFGPLLSVMPFKTEEEAIALANDSDYGLNASVWTRDIHKGREVAGRIIAGSCAVNDVIKNIGNPDMPFGGEKQSGFGRYHGPEGLLCFSRQKSVMVNSGTRKKELNWFPYNSRLYRMIKALLGLLHGGTLRKRAGKLIELAAMSIKKNRE